MPVDATTPHFTDPTSFYGQSGKLSDAADTSQVTTGAGGTAVVRDRDSMLGVAPSQQGITGTFRGADAAMQSLVNAHAPLLTPGTVFLNTSDAVMLSLHHAHGFMHKSGGHLRRMVLPQEEDADPLAALQREMRTQLKQVAPLTFQWKLRSGPIKKRDKREREERDQQEKDGQAKDEDELLQEVARALRARLDSSDPEEVYQALLLITPEELLPLEAELRALAKEIAARNAQGENHSFHSFDPKTTASRVQSLIDSSGKGEDYRKRFSQLIVHLAYRLSALNAASLHPQPPDPLLLALSSPQQTVVSDAIGTLVEPDLPSVQHLASAIAEQNQHMPMQALRSAHIGVIAQALQEMIEPSDPLIDIFASRLASHNEAYLFTEMLACDPTTILQALYGLIDTQIELTEGENAGIEHYLQAISIPIAYMNGLRCTASLSEYMAEETWRKETMQSTQKELQVARAVAMLKAEATAHGALYPREGGVKRLQTTLDRMESLKKLFASRGDRNATLLAIGAICLMTSVPPFETKTVSEVSASLAHNWLATAIPTIAHFCLLLATIGAIVMAMAEEFTSPDADEEESLMMRTKNLFSAPRALKRVWSIFALSLITGGLPSALMMQAAIGSGLEENESAKISLIATLILWRLVVETTKKLEKDPEGNRAEESLGTLLNSFSRQYKEVFTQVDTYFEMLRTLAVLKEGSSSSESIEYIRKTWTEFPWEEGSLQNDAERCAYTARTVLALFHDIVDEASSITSRMYQRT